MPIPSDVRIVEVGPRDGLQNEAVTVPVATRVALIEALADAGLSSIEAGSFVSPRWVPQMAGTAEVLAGIRHRLGVTHAVLVPNMVGLTAAMAAGAKEIAVFASVSETFSRRNINCSVGESLDRFGRVCEAALMAGIRVRGYVSCVLGCPYEGDIPACAVASVASAMASLGCHEISLGDTIGAGTPLRVSALLDEVTSCLPVSRLAVHFHDTYGQALANVLASLQAGVSVIDSAVSGLGGCPYAAGASGNLATEDLVYMLDGMGIRTGVDLPLLLAAGRLICGALGQAPRSKLGRLPEFGVSGGRA